MYVEVTCKECETKNMLPIKDANRNYKCSCGNIIVLEKVDAGHSTLRFVMKEQAEQTPSGLMAMAPTQTPLPASVSSEAHALKGNVDRFDYPLVNQSFGTYEILDIIGKGGMGNVYKAKQKGLDRIVALKTMIAGEAASEEMIERFQLEARSAGKLKHPNIVQVHDVGEIESKHFFAMDYVDGPSLKEVIQSRQMTVKETFELMIKVADAIQYAHEQGIIHRDLKPHNILINSRGEPQVADFGLAKNISDKKGFTVTGQVMGTPQYMPPEQAKGLLEQIGPKTDVYSLGAVLYEVFTGQPPFTGTTPIMIMYQVCEEEVVPPRKVRPDLPAEVEVILLKCLEKEPERRYPSAKALAADLRAYLAGDTISARPANLFYKARKKIRKNKLLSSVIALALIISLSFGGWALAEAGKAEKQKERAEAMYAEAQKQKLHAEKQRAEALASRQSAEEQKAKAQQAAEDEKLAKNQAEKARQEAETAKQQAEQNLQQANAATLLKERELYYVQINNAANILKEGDAEAARKMLAATKEDYRDLEYRLLMKKAAPRLLYTYKGKPANNNRGFGGAVTFTAVKFAPDSKSLIVMDSSSSVHEIDLSTVKAKMLKEQRAEPFLFVNMAPICFEFAPNATQVAVGKGSGEVAVTDYLTNKSVYFGRPHYDAVYSTAFSRDGKQLITLGFDRVVNVIDIATGKVVNKMEKLVGEGHSVALSPDGTRLAVGYLDRYVNICDIQTGNVMMTFGDYGENPVLKMFDKDLDIGNQYQQKRLGKKAYMYITMSVNIPAIQSLAFSYDGRFLAAGYDNGVIRIWDIANGDEKYVLQSNGGIVESLAFSPDGGLLASCSSSVRIWNVRQDLEVANISNQDPVSHIRFSPDNSTLYVANREGAVFNSYDTKTGVRLKHGPAKYSYQTKMISPDCRFVLCGSTRYSLEDIDTGETVYSDRGKGSLNEGFILTNDGHFFLTFQQSPRAKEPGKIGVYFSKNGMVSHEIPLKGMLSGIVFPDDKTVACMYGNSLDTIEIQSGKVLSTVDFKKMSGDYYFSGLIYNKSKGFYAMSGNKRQRASMHDGVICLWDAKDGQLLQTMSGHRDEIQGIAFVNNGKRLLSTSKDFSVKIWDTESGREILSLPGHRGEINGLYMSQDSTMFATADKKNVVKIWHTFTDEDIEKSIAQTIELMAK